MTHRHWANCLATLGRLTASGLPECPGSRRSAGARSCSVTCWPRLGGVGEHPRVDGLLVGDGGQRARRLGPPLRAVVRGLAVPDGAAVELVSDLLNLRSRQAAQHPRRTRTRRCRRSRIAPGMDRAPAARSAYTPPDLGRTSRRWPRWSANGGISARALNNTMLRPSARPASAANNHPSSRCRPTTPTTRAAAPNANGTGYSHRDGRDFSDGTIPLRSPQTPATAVTAGRPVPTESTTMSTAPPATATARRTPRLRA